MLVANLIVDDTPIYDMAVEYMIVDTVSVSEMFVSDIFVDYMPLDNISEAICL
jgi:hypothetical protein